MGPAPPQHNSRRYPARPLLGVGALLYRRGCVLLVERGTEPLKGYWSLPGGLVEPGERLSDAIRREVREETGLVVEPLHVAELFERIMRDEESRPEYHYVLVDYLCRVVGGTLQPADDAKRAAWIARTDLPHYSLTAGTRDVIERHFPRRGSRRSGLQPCGVDGLNCEASE